MRRATLRIRVGLTIALVSIALVIYLIISDTKIHGWTPWG
jgi:hypothetical protein